MSSSVRGVIHLWFAVIYLFPIVALVAIVMVVFMVSHCLSMVERSACVFINT